MKSYVRFEVVHELPKTNVYAVVSRSSTDGLGFIKWYAPWRQYCFFPHSETVWAKNCLNEVNIFIEELMNERRATRTKS